MVKVGDFIFPTDFVVMEMPVDSQMPLVIGRPFLNTADVIVRVKDRKISIGIGANRLDISCCKTVEITKESNEDCLVINSESDFEKYWQNLLVYKNKLIEERREKLRREGKLIVFNEENGSLELGSCSNELKHEQVVSRVDRSCDLDSFDKVFEEYWEEVVLAKYGGLTESQELDNLSDDLALSTSESSSEEICVEDETVIAKMPLRSYLPSLLDLAETKYGEDEYGSGKHYEFSFKYTIFVDFKEPVNEEICTNVLYLHVYDHGVYNLEQLRAAKSE